MLICEREDETVIEKVPFRAPNFFLGYRLLSRLEIAARGDGTPSEMITATPFVDVRTTPAAARAVRRARDVLTPGSEGVSLASTVGAPEAIPESPKQPVHVSWEVRRLKKADRSEDLIDHGGADEEFRRRDAAERR